MSLDRPSTSAVFLRGDLATPRRTVLGVFGHFAQAELPPQEVQSLLLSCGLPMIALEEPDIPITHDQQLACIAALLDRVGPEPSIPAYALGIGLDVRITTFGVLGLALLHAPDLPACLRVVTEYPELSWGHSQIAVGRQGEHLFQAFTLDGRVTGEALRHYCVTVDLVATVRMIEDLFGPHPQPESIWLPYPAPPDAAAMRKRLACPLRFDAPEARVVYPSSLLGATPRLANPLLFRAYEKLCRQLARQLRTDVDLAEQVRRLLWLSSPPPDRAEVARMLALSPRTLARRLAAEGTSYGALQREVRFARARELLRDRSRSLAEIAAALGFSDPGAFSRAFKAWTGEPPSAWRED